MPRALVAILGITTACGFTATSATEGNGPGSDAAFDGAALTIIDAAIDAAATPSNHRRKPMTMGAGKVTGMQTDFPMWVDLVDPDIAARAQANGSDIYFTLSDGTVLDHELQLADAANHHFSAWVRVPSLKADTKLYVHYGDPGAAPAPNPKGVFKSSFAAVWHLDDANPLAAIADATGTHPGTPHLTAAATKAATGQLGKGLAFGGTASERIEFTNPLADNNAHTISVWVSQGANLTHTAAIVNMGTPSLGTARWLHGHYNAGLGVGFYSYDVAPNPPVNIDGAGWTHLVWTFEGPNKKNHIYRNGAEIMGSPYMPSGAGNPAIATAGTPGYIGYAPSQYGAANEYVGTIDELRIATVQRSNEWIATEYANQSAPGTFCTLGAEETP